MPALLLFQRPRNLSMTVIVPGNEAFPVASGLFNTAKLFGNQAVQP